MENTRSLTLTPVATAVAQLRFVSFDSNGTVGLTGSGVDAIGISLEASAADTQVAIPVALLDGAILEIESGAAVAVGDRVMSDATGRAITATGATARVLGFATTASSAAGEFISIIARPAAGEFTA